MIRVSQMRNVRWCQGRWYVAEERALGYSRALGVYVRKTRVGSRRECDADDDDKVKIVLK
jgi:hypothetical protein